MKNLELLNELGFHTATEKINKKVELSKKLHIAYQNYEFVMPDDINKFNDILRSKTEKSQDYRTTYDKLVFHNVANYTEAPPEFVLDKMKEAVSKQCFDEFEIAKIESVQEIPDPILFGKVNGCGDYFFITQWDNDVTLEMIREATN